MTLEEIKAEMVAMCGVIETWFIDDVRVTIVVRNTQRDQSNIVVTKEDEMQDAIAVLEGEGLS